ncbi:MAG TPA: hypothetical protein ENN42_05505 [Thioalkalivibrio sp.]|nr:hypothetical protein [Thioalkalivibrio sp.]
MADVWLVWIRDHGAIGIALFLAVENIGVPWPTTLAYIVAIELVQVGELSWLGALLVCTLGHVTGSLIGYALGRGGDNLILRRARNGNGLGRTIEWLHTWFDRHGIVTILVARLVGYVRPWASIAAGLGEVRLGAFVLWTTIGTAVHVALALWLAQAGSWFWDAYPSLRVALVVLVALVFWGAFFYAVIRLLLTRCRRGRVPTARAS